MAKKRRFWFDPERDVYILIRGSGFDNHGRIVVWCEIVDEDRDFVPTNEKYVVLLWELFQKFQEAGQ